MRTRDDSPWKLKLVELAAKRKWTIHFMPAEERRKQAGWAIQALGPAARPVMPELVELLKDDKTVLPAMYGLARMGSEAKLLEIPLLNHTNEVVRQTASSGLLKLAIQPEGKQYADRLIPVFLRNLHDSSSIVRSDAAGGLKCLADAATAVPALIPNMNDPDPYVRTMTAQALGGFGKSAREAVPVLIKSLEDPDSFLRDRAAVALKAIDPEAAAKVGVK